MATAPSEVREGLTLVTSAAAAQTAASIAGIDEPEVIRGVLFDVAPLLVGAYSEGTAALAVDWYEELRDEAPTSSLFTPEPLALVREEELDRTIAWATDALRSVEEDIERAINESMAKLLPEIEREVAAAFWSTMTENVKEDPDAVGWRRHARPGACPFCRMLASKGAVYKSDTARFAAHTNCYCTASPVFDGQPGEEASVLQYRASSRRRGEAERANLREYLKANFGA